MITTYIYFIFIFTSFALSVHYISKITKHPPQFESTLRVCGIAVLRQSSRIKNSQKHGRRNPVKYGAKAKEYGAFSWELCPVKLLVTMGRHRFMACSCC